VTRPGRGPMRLHDTLREVCRMSNTDSISGGAWGSENSENVAHIYFQQSFPV